MSGKPRQFCPKGHDKYKPNGSYMRLNAEGYLVNDCAVCKREWQLAYYYKVKRDKMHASQGVTKDVTSFE